MHALWKMAAFLPDIGTRFSGSRAVLLDMFYEHPGYSAGNKDWIELLNFSIEFLDKFRKFHGFFLKNCKIPGILGEFGHF